MPSHIFSGFLILIVLVGIFFYGSADAWNEAFMAALIFVVSGLEILRARYDSEPADERRRNFRLLLPLALLAGYSFLQSFATLIYGNNSLSPGLLFYSFDALAGLWVAVKTLALVCFALLLINHFGRHIGRLVWGAIGTGAFFAVLGIVRFLVQLRDASGEFLLPVLRRGVGFGTFINQNHFALLMLMTLGLIFALALKSDFGREKRFGLLALGVLVLTALILTGSRAGILSSGGVILFLLILPSPRGGENDVRRNFAGASRLVLTKVFAIIALSVALLLGVVWVGQDRVIRRFEKLPSQIETDASSDGYKRIEIWAASVKVIRENLFGGVGFGGFKVAVSEHIDISGETVPHQAHNDYLEFMASGGAVAVALAIWFLWRFLTLVRRRFKEPSTIFADAARAGALAGIVGVGIHSFFDFGLQLFGNLLFFTALVTIAVAKTDLSPNAAGTASENSGKRQPTAAKRDYQKTIFVAVYFLACVVLTAFSIRFGVSRLYLHGARTNPADAAAFDRAAESEFPGDADFYHTKADLLLRDNQYQQSAAAFERAVAARPHDYLLHLRAGHVEQLLEQDAAATASFRRAVGLAPFYADPHLFLGNHLVKIGAPEEGFEHLRAAYERRAAYFESVARFAWRRAGENPAETIRLLSPLSPENRARLAEFLIDNNAAASVPVLTCGEAATLTGDARERITGKLFVGGYFHLARQVSGGSCEAAGELSNVEDGGFETADIRTGQGFGWRSVSLPNAVRLFIDEGAAAEGNRSLSIAFDGSYNSALPILSQIVSVEKRRRYRLRLAVRSADIVTGGAPSLQIILKGKDYKTEAEAVRLPIRPEMKWNELTVDFQSGERAEAIEIRLARESCAQSPCPVFGRLWIDDVRLTALD